MQLVLQETVSFATLVYQVTLKSQPNFFRNNVIYIAICVNCRKTSYQVSVIVVLFKLIICCISLVIYM